MSSHDVVVYSNNSPIVVNFVHLQHTSSRLVMQALRIYSRQHNQQLFHFLIQVLIREISHPLRGDSRRWISPNAVNNDPTHMYATQGIFTVCLSIHTSTGCPIHTCQNVVVGGGGGCHADFVAYPDSAPHQTARSFYLYLNGEILIPLLWNFGDSASGAANTATTQDPWHTFTYAGTFTVCLTIHGDSCEDQTCREINCW